MCSIEEISYGIIELAVNISPDSNVSLLIEKILTFQATYSY